MEWLDMESEDRLCLLIIAAGYYFVVVLEECCGDPLSFSPWNCVVASFATLFLVDFSSIVSRLVLSGNGFLRHSGCFDGEHSTTGFPLVLNLLPSFPLPDTSFFRLVLCCVMVRC
jgi:hypothetical protein